MGPVLPGGSIAWLVDRLLLIFTVSASAVTAALFRGSFSTAFNGAAETIIVGSGAGGVIGAAWGAIHHSENPKAAARSAGLGAAVGAGCGCLDLVCEVLAAVFF